MLIKFSRNTVSYELILTFYSFFDQAISQTAYRCNRAISVTSVKLDVSLKSKLRVRIHFEIEANFECFIYKYQILTFHWILP